MKGFGSDNHSGVHPELLKAIVSANTEHAPSYGTDEYSEKAIRLFKEKFGQQTEVFFVFNGTAANVLSLRFLTERHESILCSDVSHLNLDECGAPEFFAAKLITVKSTEGKMSLADLKASLKRKGDQHYTQSRVVSLTQPTELGTCYSLEEIRAICQWAHSEGMRVHLDGARLTNALIHLNCTFKEMTTDLGVDVVSFGGTKNGLMMGEAILVLSSDLIAEAKKKLKFIRKQAAQLPSKTRFIACQFERYLSSELYLQIAQHSCSMAQKLFEGVSAVPQVKVTATRQSNAVFATIPKPWVKHLKEKYFFYVWDESNFECRLMTSWDTQPSEIDGFVNLLKQFSETT
ncbi:MAG: low specificity L-threonine aldolase protein [Pseudobdellovibrio sp.]|jgi:threonine aldolase|nr:low specificity L-threonine aldolase protein [Pseudobdellovibrio sp.]